MSAGVDSMRYFHGRNKKKSYFEGWYLKHQNDEETLAFIPGIRIDEFGERGAFIQIIKDKASFWFSFPFNDFTVHEDKFHLRIKDSVFSDNGASIDIDTDSFICKGNIEYGPLTVPSKGFMGPFKYVPFMECNHGVMSIGHSVKGEVVFSESKEDTRIVFDQGSSGYIETDWGDSFPENYVWTQCNRFPGEDISIMVAAADIPFLGTKFLGVTGIVSLEGEEFRLATYKGARVLFSDRDSLIIAQGKRRFEVSVYERDSLPLSAPRRGSMMRLIRESARCRARFRCWDKERLVLDAVSEQASWEYISGTDLPDF